MKRKKSIDYKIIALVLVIVLVSIGLISFQISGKNSEFTVSQIYDELNSLNFNPELRGDRIIIKLNKNNGEFILNRLENLFSKFEIQINILYKGKENIILGLNDKDKNRVGELELIKEKNRIDNNDNIIKQGKSFKKYKYISIIFDDAGYGNKNIYRLVKYPLKIAIAVLPNLRKSKEISHIIFENNKEVMLHMPMEPENVKKRHIKLLKNTILTGLREEEINRRIDEMFRSVDYIKGVNNHQGSLLTEDKDSMYYVLKRIKEDKLFFIDSLTSSHSVVKKIAKILNVKVAQRDIFLDNVNKYDYVKKQMDKLIKIALKRGYAIGIAHVSHSKAVDVIYDYIPVFQEKGIKLIFPSELIEKIYYNNKEVI